MNFDRVIVNDHKFCCLMEYASLGTYLYFWCDRVPESFAGASRLGVWPQDSMYREQWKSPERKVYIPKHLTSLWIENCCYFGRLKAAGLPVRFCTNETTMTRNMLTEKLHRLGFSMKDEEIFPPIPAVCKVLQKRNLRPHLLVHPSK